jgi:hypothetical protein
MKPRTGRRAAQDAAFKFTGSASEQSIRESAEFAADQPELRVFLATLGRDDVQRNLAANGARVGGV